MPVIRIPAAELAAALIIDKHAKAQPVQIAPIINTIPLE
jgi:hypothetical protein